MRKKLWSHPGEILKLEFLEPMNISVYALAKAIGVPRTRLNDIVLGRRGITADTAIRLAQFFQTDAVSWLNLQLRYELMKAQDSKERTYAKIPNFEAWQSAHA